MMKTGWGKKASTISLASLISIIVALLIAGAVYSGLSGIYGDKKIDHSNRLDKFKDIIYNVRYEEGEGAKEEYSLFVEPYEMYLFYSSGNGPIYLTSSMKENDEFMRIERPDYTSECEDSACICYCKDGPFWRTGEDEDGDFTIESHPKLTFSTDMSDKGYMCRGMTCQSVEPSSTIFFNSRGMDGAYTEAVLKRYDEYTGEDEDTGVDKNLYYATPLDMPILLTHPGRIILADTLGKQVGKAMLSPAPIPMKIKTVSSALKYEKGTQSKNTLKGLTNNFFWVGGVAVGASGTPKSERDIKNHKVRGVEMTLTFQKTPVNNGIAICLADECAFENAITFYDTWTSKMQAQDITESAIENYEGFIEVSLSNCVEDAETEADYDSCFIDLETRTIDMFTQIENGMPQVLKEKKHGMQVVLDRVKEGDDEYTNISVRKNLENDKKIYFTTTMPFGFPQVVILKKNTEGLFDRHYENIKDQLIINGTTLVETSSSQGKVLQGTKEYLTLEGRSEEKFRLDGEKHPHKGFTLMLVKINESTNQQDYLPDYTS